jgi:chemosensory pili system protein ChpA (sensor histidine kinase/response regulator)
VQPPVEIDGIDFGSLAAVSDLSCAVRADAAEPSAAADELIIDMADFALPEPSLEEPASVPEPIVWMISRSTSPDPQPEACAARVPEVTETIEPMNRSRSSGRCASGSRLYNVYLNEADEWSRRLATEVAEWALS